MGVALTVAPTSLCNTNKDYYFKIKHHSKTRSLPGAGLAPTFLYNTNQDHYWKNQTPLQNPIPPRSRHVPGNQALPATGGCGPRAAAPGGRPGLISLARTRPEGEVEVAVLRGPF